MARNSGNTATTAGENVDASCYPRKDKILQDMLKTNRTLRQTAQKTKMEQERQQNMGKQIWRRRRFVKRKFAQDNLNKDLRAGRAPSGGKRATYMGVVHGQGSDRRAYDLLREPLRRQEGERDRGQSSSRLLAKLLHS